VVGTQSLDRFIAEHRLPESFRNTATNVYEPLAGWLRVKLVPGTPFLLGINGAQGTGKSTLADYLALTIFESCKRNVAVLSIDDFYLTKAERQLLSRTLHPLLAVRGVPGTHDIPMLREYLQRLRDLEPGEQCRLPRFDKAADDRADEACWPSATGPIDLVVLEGWCVGSPAEPDDRLDRPVNTLEKTKDPDTRWRRYVNERLASDYAELFEALDALVFLRAPGFEAILRWRIEQEHKLAASAEPGAAGIMNDEQVREFIEYFERVTRNNLATVGSNADIVLELDEYHDCVAIRYRD
jgi:D-glycerate 3-kinase